MLAFVRGAARLLLVHVDLLLWLAALAATLLFAYRERANPSLGGGMGFTPLDRSIQQRQLWSSAALTEILAVVTVVAAAVRIRRHWRVRAEAALAVAVVAATVAAIGLYWPTLQSYPTDAEFIQRPYPWPEVREDARTRFVRAVRSSEKSLRVIDGNGYQPHEPRAVVSAFRAERLALKFLGGGDNLLFDVVPDAAVHRVEARVYVFPSASSARADAVSFERKYRQPCAAYDDPFRVLRRSNVVVSVRSGCAPDRLPASVALVGRALSRLPGG